MKDGTTDNHHLLWGDLHNHNALGYGQGSLDRSYAIAASHLDFYAFTPHAQYCDGNAPDGYEIVKSHWPQIQQAAKSFNRPGKFTTLLAYEWHSRQWGHYCIFYEKDNQPLHFAMTLEELQQFVRRQPAFMLPHHIGYLNGIDWKLFDEGISPVIEIYSDHGCCERDGGPYEYLGHSEGCGGYRFNAQYGLKHGKRFGFIAGTDGHDGFPGGYGLGLTGVWAKGNTRSEIAEAIRARRTIAVTGDRIAATFQANGQPIGSLLTTGQKIDLTFLVVGWDVIRCVELLCNSVPVAYFRPDYGRYQTPHREQAYRFRIEWGWGPMKGYQIYDWTGSLLIKDGQLTQAVPCFRSDPFDEFRRKQITELSTEGCQWQSHTSRGGIFTTRNSALTCGPTDAITVEVLGTPQTQIDFKLTCSTKQSILSTPADWSVCNAIGSNRLRVSIGDLLEGSRAMDLTRETGTWALVHRAVTSTMYSISGSYCHTASSGPAYYYLRAAQENGQMMWSSPIWIDP